MEENFQNISKFLNEETISFVNKKLNPLIQGYNFFFVQEMFISDKNQGIFQNLNESEVAIIDVYEDVDSNDGDRYFIIGFKKTIILIKEFSLAFLHELFSNALNLNIYFLTNNKELIDRFNIYKYKLYQNAKNDLFLKNEIMNFNDKFIFKESKLRLLYKIWSIVDSCITGFLIIQSYIRLKNKDRYDSFSSKSDAKFYDEKDYIELRQIGIGSSFKVDLVYLIEKQEIIAIKKKNGFSNEHEKLVFREIENYKQINHPLLPNFYGIVKKGNYTLFEFINGSILFNIPTIEIEVIISIIFELIIIFDYLHAQGFIYRDLSPRNIMIDQNKTAVLIDFDRMIKESETLSDDYQYTKDLQSNFAAPEVNSGKSSFSSDIYSIGKMMQFISTKISQNSSKNKIKVFETFLNQMYDKCTNDDPEKRPDIVGLFSCFLITFLGNNQTQQLILNLINKIQKVLQVNGKLLSKVQLFNLGVIFLNDEYVTKDIKAAINYMILSANQEYSLAEYNLGMFYYKGTFKTKDIYKAINYLSLSANRNCIDAQYNLGIIYDEGKEVSRNVKKAIHYYLLAAKSNHIGAQLHLAYIYYKEINDIDKAIHYFSLAADQNNPNAQYNLGIIYESFQQDILKAIHYFTLAAKQNYQDAQFRLDSVFRIISEDLDEAIHCFSLAAAQNNRDAQFYLGIIFSEGTFISRSYIKYLHSFVINDNSSSEPNSFHLLLHENKAHVQININKAIKYLFLAANQNDIDAIVHLAIMFYKGDQVKRDINKAIYYFSLASNQNEKVSQFNLGLIYYEGKYVEPDLQKAIFYFSLASNNNKESWLAQFYLGGIYLEKMHNVDKAIYYYKLSAEQNYSDAQYELGNIYYSKEYDAFDIDKAMHYFTLAANKSKYAQYALGNIYSEGIYVQRDINKAIYYYTLAANQNYDLAQLSLGNIFYNDDDVPNDTNKAIKYYSLAANQNCAEALFNLAVIYFEGKSIKRDINQAIKYYTLASHQNMEKANFILGTIYFMGVDVTRDIDKAIYYFSLAANDNIVDAQEILGWIYSDKKIGVFDINKAIKYFSLAADQNHLEAQNSLGVIYYSGKYVKRDLKKALYYFNLAANRKHPESLFYLGKIYLLGEIGSPNYDKAINYLTQAANKNNRSAQYYLGLNYLYGIHTSKKIQWGISYLIRSSENRENEAHFELGCLYYEGIYVERDIQKSIHYFKEASSNNHNYSKNNLAVIYKNEFKTYKSIQYAIELLNEAIKQKNDFLSKYNLALIYVFEKGFENKIDESIDLLISAFISDSKFQMSAFLLLVALDKIYGADIKSIKERLARSPYQSKELTDFIIRMAKQLSSDIEKKTKQEIYEIAKLSDYFYCHLYQIVSLKALNDQMIKQKPKTNKTIQDINKIFYEGFGLDLI
ncbi:hypothetical protein M9Y10_000539 [Tritrichomonas musculus]|uniref:Protein kinase domain-containing protein n=1 Tax=Tritrichomonas musculus TaxID=1915356 RepID=A0ABR2L5J1_9EUKA